MIQHYITVFFREFNKYKIQNIISITGLAVSLLCFSLCMYCCRYMQSLDTCYSNYKRIAELQIHSSKGPFSGTPATLAEKLQTLNYPEIEMLTRVVYLRERPYNAIINEDKILPYTLATLEVDTSYNQVFTPEIIAGSWEMAAHAPNSVVMAESTARKIFGQPNDALGKQIILDRRLNTSPESTPKTGGIAYTVKVIVRDFPVNVTQNLMQVVDILTLNDSEGLLNSEVRKNMTGCDTYVLLQKGKKPADLEKHFRSSELQQHIFNEDMDVSASRIGNASSKQFLIQVFSWITGVAGILILRAGVLNFFHFLTGSFLNRMREYSIRKVAGGNTRQLFGLLFVQSALLLTISFLLMFCLLELIGPGLRISMFRFDLEFNRILLIQQVIQYFVFLLLLCGFICTATALRIRNSTIQTGIRGSGKRSGKHILRNLMLGIQLFISWLFISFAVALYLQFDKTTTTLFGTLSKTEKESIFSVSLDYSFMKNEEKLDLAEHLRGHAGVQDILLSDISYTEGVSGNYMQTKKDDPNSAIDVNIMSIPSNFFSFMQIPLLSGRSVETNSDMLVDRTFADRHPKESQMGASLYNNDSPFSVCGIAPTFYRDVYSQNEGFAFIPTDFTYYVGHCYIKCYPGQEKAVKHWISQVLKEKLPSSVTPRINTFLEDIMEEQALENTLKDIVLFFSIVCLCIALLGIYSAITLDTEYRKKEVAIRKINGAGMRAIVLLFARLYIRLLLFSAVLALPLVALAFSFWKRMYTVFFNDGIFFWISIFMAVTAILVLTVSSRILLISRINPASMVKTE